MSNETVPPQTPEPPRGRRGWLWVACGLLAALALAAACGAAGLAAVFVLNAPRQPTAVVPTSTSTPQSQILLQDDFSDPDSGWDEYDDLEGSVRYQDGGLHVTVNEADLSIWSTLDRVFEDFSLEVSGGSVEGPPDGVYGVLFRYADWDNFYEFDVSGDGYYMLSKLVDGEVVSIVDWTESPVIRQGQSVNRLRVDVRGATIDCYVNGELVASVDDSEFPRGIIGLSAGPNAEPGGHVVFDDLLVRRLPD